MSINKVKANELENEILKVVGEALGYNDFGMRKWTEKYGKQVLCQIINKRCLRALQKAYRKGFQVGKVFKPVVFINKSTKGLVPFNIVLDDGFVSYKYEFRTDGHFSIDSFAKFIDEKLKENNQGINVTTTPIQVEIKEVTNKVTEIKLTKAEIQSNYNRVQWAEGLIRQLPKKHEGRNSWLLNYGESNEAIEIQLERKKRGN